MAQLIRLRDFTFLLYDVFHAERLCEAARYRDHDRATFDAILETAKLVAEREFEPFAAKLDQNPPEWVDGKIVKYVTPTERMDRVRQQNDGLVGKMPKFKRGMYLVRWQVKGDSKRFDEDYVSDGDATLEEA